VPGGLLTSKPTWWNTFGWDATSAFFVFLAREVVHKHRGDRGALQIGV
jgi:hypothetical protein